MQYLYITALFAGGMCYIAVALLMCSKDVQNSSVGLFIILGPCDGYHVCEPMAKVLCCCLCYHIKDTHHALSVHAMRL